MNEEVKKYKDDKHIIAVMLNPFLIQNDSRFFCIDALKTFKDMIDEFTQHGAIVSGVKEGLFKFLSNAREVNDSDREKRIEIINDIITLLNRQIENPYLDFYRLELVKRKRNLKYITQSNDDIYKLVSEVNGSIGYDSYILRVFSNEISDENFIQEDLPELSRNPFYIDSINAILNDCPMLFTDLTFYNRNMCVLNSLDEDIYVDNKKMIKKIVKQLKKIK